MQKSNRKTIKKKGAVSQKPSSPKILGTNKIVGYNSTKNRILFDVISSVKIQMFCSVKLTQWNINH